MGKLVTKITDRDMDFAAWYTDIIREADLVAYSSVKGSMIIRPYGYAIWENMQNYLDREFKLLGHQNVQMPMFIPESLLNVEKEHVKGFAPEVAWVTQGGDNLLEEKMCVRPTSEVLFCEHFKNIIKSYRDLPLLYNQWCTIVRWEKTTRPFLRSREILWQEGHTMHKTEKEKFAGAIETYTIEAMMYDGVALQNGTSHYFGQGFAKSFGITFLDEKNELQTPYQTSWGCTTRMIGGVIMTHGDNHGLVLPPKIAPIKVRFIPIKESEKINEVIQKISSQLNKEITYDIDHSDKSPGFKFADAEVKGIPIRIEIGERDLENDVVTIVRRDTLEKIQIKIEDVPMKVEELLEQIQTNLYERALKRRDSMIYETDDYEEFKEIAATKPGFILTNWCGNTACEDKVKEETGLKSRCIKEDYEEGLCPFCKEKSKYKIYFGRQY